MIETGDQHWHDCPKNRALIQRLFDRDAGGDAGSSMPAEPDVEQHLSACEACREYVEGMVSLREGLRSLPRVPFPDDALETVWSQTVGAGTIARWATRRLPVRPVAPTARWWTVTAAVAALAVAIAGWQWFGTGSGNATNGRVVSVVAASDLSRAAVETRMAFELANDAFVRIERAALTDTRVDRVRTALLRVPMRWVRKGRTDNEL